MKKLAWAVWICALVHNSDALMAGPIITLIAM